MPAPAIIDAYVKAIRTKEDERREFQVEMELTMGELEELLSLQLPCALRTKLAMTYQKAKHDCAMSEVDFGDLKED